ncbi:hypothetical protein EHS25_003737 [Saitozyma podzolica]|uniref:F-box domain-containing protein n=1 Tax=Saitozyma podzolica TaxID=1890683 RepID=A0A427Y3A2_9TREE|nr:hypothetical protein EHS25_003737 [Saitozyma podzolica]
MTEQHELPAELWLVVKSHCTLPSSHIALSKVCRQSREAYHGAGTWRFLCRQIGIGRSVAARQMTWKEVFHRVVAHQRKCRVPACYRFGVPPLDSTGDLLNRKAALDHFHHLKDRRLRSEADPCSDDDEDYEDCDGSDPGDESNLSGHLHPDTNSSSKQETHAPLLPLSQRNVFKVPSRPELHQFLATAGGETFSNFVQGDFSLAPGRRAIPKQHGSIPSSSKGFSWDDGHQPEARGDLTEHLLLQEAFSTNPPVTVLKMEFLFVSTAVKNRDGVTVSDVISHLEKWTSGRPTKREIQLFTGFIVTTDPMSLLMGVADPFERMDMFGEMAAPVSCPW